MTTIYQHGTLAQLVARQMSGTITVAEMLEHGDTGIGTFEGLDGEGIFLNGEAYQADSSGKVHHITDKQTTLPFASIHFDQPEVSQKLPFRQVNYSELTKSLQDKQLFNVFSALKVHGEFSHVHVRIVARQEKPYPSLLQVAEQQPEFEAENIIGTLVGYYAPKVFGGPTAAGWHLHFLSDDLAFAGHVLDFNATDVDGTIQIFDNFLQHLPINNEDFRSMNQDITDLDKAIEASEGGKN
ncbi:acetolactate decarboxylase [Leuconostoc litchii]|uniref:Alpha-acetolactate decarboxylase n=1 Tax=Leuconostoc litchii TaxID=1981069 RepID=A0A6P2CSX9_9LACO|nr:acetolactate decarboxylase [Leuconostoc litchii]TYC47377.1 acetolactate decarboxylase [Leuconostoc litchii]